MSLRSIAAAALALAALAPATAPAQEREAPRPRNRVLVRPDGDAQGPLRDRIRMVTTRRARLGVVVDLNRSENDSIGATLQSVSPGGPAARAGIRSGDIITRLDGKSLTASDGVKVEGDPDQSLPGLRLVELAAKLEPDDTISVEFRRDGARRTVTLVTGNEPMTEFAFGGPEGGRVWSFQVPEFERIPMPDRARIEGRLRSERTPDGGFVFTIGGPLADLELAPLNADLGAYFGTTEGVLVISVPKESTLGLKAGDVILTVDGRKATTPGSLMRILRSYDAGEAVKFEVMRNKGRQTVTGKLEKDRDE